MEITIKDLYENIDTLPKSLYREVNNYIQYLKSKHSVNSDYEVPQWQIEETRKRAKYLQENPETVVSEAEMIRFLKELEDEM